MWTFNNRTGEIFDNGELAGNGYSGHGYSGHGAGVLNPGLESVHGVGPIPAGKWRVVEWINNYPTKGPVVARLEPVGHDAHGRTGFLIHGDNAEQNHTASHGCIIAARFIRQAWRASKDLNLEVVS